MSAPGELIVDRLVKHAAAYFSTIRARKSAPDLDPFLASLMEDAIRAKAGLPPREPAPSPAANGANDVPHGVPGVLAVMKAGDPEGMLYSEIKRAGFTSKTTVTRGLAKLIAAGVVLPKNSRGRYQLTGKEPDSPLDGRSLTQVTPAGGADLEALRILLRDKGMRPGKVMLEMLAFLRAHPQESYGAGVLKKELGLSESNGGTVNRTAGILAHAGFVTKLGEGGKTRYQATPWE